MSYFSATLMVSYAITVMSYKESFYAVARIRYERKLELVGLQTYPKNPYRLSLVSQTLAWGGESGQIAI